MSEKNVCANGEKPNAVSSDWAAGRDWPLVHDRRTLVPLSGHSSVEVGDSLLEMSWASPFSWALQS